jgi:hypothetical protein
VVAKKRRLQEVGNGLAAIPYDIRFYTKINSFRLLVPEYSYEKSYQESLWSCRIPGFDYAPHHLLRIESKDSGSKKYLGFDESRKAPVRAILYECWGPGF